MASAQSASNFADAEIPVGQLLTLADEAFADEEPFDDDESDFELEVPASDFDEDESDFESEEDEDDFESDDEDFDSEEDDESDLAWSTPTWRSRASRCGRSRTP